MVITERKKVAEVIERIQSQRVCLPIFCTASHWNTEAILVAAKNISERYNIQNIPVAVAITYDYQYMPQARRITYDQNPRTGFLAIMKHLMVLAGDPQSSYYPVQVLPHLDHGHPERDRWPLTEGTEYLASVMFDAQYYPLNENIKLTQEYVKKYRKSVFIEGIMDELNVSEAHVKAPEETDDYAERAREYVKETGIDFLVPDLGTEQQSGTVGGAVYLKNRAREIHRLVSGKIMVLHGTSCLSEKEIASLPDDGILRVNMWTRIAREAGLHAYRRMLERDAQIQKNDFNAIESHRYLMDSIEKAAGIMEEIMLLLGYKDLK